MKNKDKAATSRKKQHNNILKVKVICYLISCHSLNLPAIKSVFYIQATSSSVVVILDTLLKVICTTQNFPP